MGEKHSWFIFELKREFYIEFRVLLMTGFLVVEKAFIPHDINLVSWLGLLLFREEFGMLSLIGKCLTKPSLAFFFFFFWLT